MKLTIIRGLPGSGKSTLARDLGCFHVESDMFHITDGRYLFQRETVEKANHWRKSMVKTGLVNGMDVVVTGTFTTAEEIRPYLDCAKEHKAAVEVVRMTASYGSIHGVPGSVVDSMRERFENIDGEIFYT